MNTICYLHLQSKTICNSKNMITTQRFAKPLLPETHFNCCYSFVTHLLLICYLVVTRFERDGCIPPLIFEWGAYTVTKILNNSCLLRQETLEML